MKKRVLSMLIALAMTLTLMTPSAMALGEEPGSSPNEALGEDGQTPLGETENVPQDNEPVYELYGEQIDLGTIVTSAEPGISLFSATDGKVDLTAGTHAKWIDRINVPDAVKTFYSVLERAADNDGENDYLIKDQYYTATQTPVSDLSTIVNGSFVEVNNTYSDGTTSHYTGILVGSTNDQSEANYLRSCIGAAYNAFDRDHPEVFWLNGGSNATIESSSRDGGTTWTHYVLFMLADLQAAANAEFKSVRADSVTESTIKSKISTLNTNANTIMGTVASDAPAYDKIVAFNDWLTKNNQYNTSSTLSPSVVDREAWECVSALAGRTGESGPVCEGYARAFKVLCDRSGIECVLESGTGYTSSGPEAHMWNLVKVDGKWYNMDVTWNDPSVGTGAVSGNENHNFLLVGSDTVNDGMKFSASHEMTNVVSTSASAVAFTNGPVAEAQDCPKPAPALGGSVSITGTAEYGEELTADTSNITDPDSEDGNGITANDLKYQWYRGEDKIGDATDSTYTAGKDDVGANLKVEVYTDTYTPVTSAPVEIDKATLELTVSGDPISLKTGATGTFTVDVTGLVGDDTLELAVASNNTGVATVAKTATGYEVTAVAAGNTTITVGFAGNAYYKSVANQTVNVTVTDLAVKSIAVATNPTKTEYTYGESFVGDGLVVTVTYDDDTTATVNYSSATMTVTPDLSKQNAAEEDVELTLTYLEKTTTFKVKISPKALTDAMVSQPADATYDGTQKTPAVTVTDGSKTLVKDTDYTVAYGENKNVSAGGTVTVTGKGNYTGTITKNFSIAQATPTLSGITVTGTVYTTTDPADVVVSGTAMVGETELTGGTWKLKEGTVLSEDVDEYTVVFTPSDTDKANCNSAEGKVTIQVQKRMLDHITVTGDLTNITYTHGDTFNPAGLTVTAFYTDDLETGETVDLSKVTFNDGDTLKAGQTDVKVSFGGKDFTLESVITVSKIQLEVDTAYVGTFTFDGEAHTVKLTNALPTGVEVTYSGDVTKTDAGNYTATATFSLASGYSEDYYEIVNKADKEALPTLTMNWSITPGTLTGINASISIKADDTGEKTVAAAKFGITEAGTFVLTEGSAVTGTGLADGYPTYGADIKVKLADDATVGDITIPVTFTAANYNPINLTLTVKVTDKDVITPSADQFTKTYNGEAVTLAELEAKLTGTEGITGGSWAVSGGALPTNAGTYSRTLTYTPDEGADFTVDPVNISIKINRATATVTGKTVTITVDDTPSPLFSDYYEVADVVTGDSIDSDITVSGVPTPLAVGTYTITITGPDISSDGNYNINYASNGTLIVTAATVAVTGVTLSPTTLALTVGGTGTLTVTVAPANATNQTVTWTSSDPSVATVSGGVVTAVGAGTATITVTTEDGGFTDTCTVTVSADGTPDYPVTPVSPIVPDFSGTPGNPSNSNNNTETNTPSNPPAVTGSPIVTPSATVNNGTAEAVVSGEMADQLVEQAASGRDTVVIAPVVPGSVTQTDVVIPASAVSGIAGSSSADLVVETPAANITLPNSSLEDLNRQGGSGVVSTAAVSGGVSIEITAGGQRVDNTAIKAEIPVDCGPGTVAVVVSGGSSTTVRKSFADGSGQLMNVPLDGSATVIFVDNSKTFSDVPGSNWAADAVAFASAHELMNGVTATSFSPNTSMTRGMLAVVLHNLEGNPGAVYAGSFTDVGSGDWYAQAVQWAADSGIIGGVGNGAFAPNASITREQLVVMLYRYAGMPASNGSLSGFSDSARVSNWAQQAMAWAVSNGIVKGSNGALNPQGSATRAEVAQMLMNFVTSGVL